MRTHRAAAGHAHHAPPLRGLAVALTGVLLALLVTSPAPAQPRSSYSQPSLSAALNLRQGLSAGAAAHRTGPGVRNPAPSAQAVAGTLKQATGLDPSQVQVENVCAPVPAGMARCASQALHLRSGGGFVRPQMHAQATLGRVRPAHPSPFLPTVTPDVGSASPEPAYDEHARVPTAGV